MRKCKVEALGSLSAKDIFWKNDSRFRGFDPEDCDRALARFFVSSHFIEDSDDLEDYMEDIYSGVKDLSKDAASYVLAYMEMGEFLRYMLSKGSKSYQMGARDALEDYFPDN